MKNMFEDARQKEIERINNIRIWSDEMGRRIESGNPNLCNHSGFNLDPF